MEEMTQEQKQLTVTLALDTWMLDAIEKRYGLPHA